MESHDAEFREGEPRPQAPRCANCGHGDLAHEYGPTCIGNRNLCVCQHFWLTAPNREA